MLICCRYDNVNNNLLYNRYNALSQYYSSSSGSSTENPYDRYINLEEGGGRQPDNFNLDTQFSNNQVICYSITSIFHSHHDDTKPVLLLTGSEEHIPTAH